MCDDAPRIWADVADVHTVDVAVASAFPAPCIAVDSNCQPPLTQSSMVSMLFTNK